MRYSRSGQPLFLAGLMRVRNMAGKLWSFLIHWIAIFLRYSCNTKAVYTIAGNELVIYTRELFATLGRYLVYKRLLFWRRMLMNKKTTFGTLLMLLALLFQSFIPPQPPSAAICDAAQLGSEVAIPYRTQEKAGD